MRLFLWVSETMPLFFRYLFLPDIIKYEQINFFNLNLNPLIAVQHFNLEQSPYLKLN